MAIDPTTLNNVVESQWNIEEFAICAICVAASKATKIFSAIDSLLESIRIPNKTPFELIAQMSRGQLCQLFKDYGIRFFNNKANYVKNLIEAKLNLWNCSLDQLEDIKGIGPKTARYFLLYTRPELDGQIAVIDTHVLKYLQYKGYKVPKTTPASGGAYKRLENLFIKHKPKHLNMRSWDLYIWNHYAFKNEICNLQY